MKLLFSIAFSSGGISQDLSRNVPENFEQNRIDYDSLREYKYQ
jgi:hypothetical protein